ncbi:hypothetical protein L1049_014252 [Liquidambar formosana]|uniref:Uncharacterized protein n=1 Tax=Liquidambar formosana TaxID=63359 RepID=A0AAP0RLY4_LIQFO
MSDTDALQISLFRSHIHSRRFDDGTLRILESVLASKDVKSSLEVRSSLREFMRFESISVIHEISEKTVEQKLSVLEFFVLAFALAGDVEVEGCLMLRGVFAVRVERLRVLVSESELSMVDLISLLVNIGILRNHVKLVFIVCLRFANTLGFDINSNLWL